MTAAVRTIMQEWAIPRMRVHKIEVTALEGNKGSVRVFEKNNFVLRETLQDCIEIRGSKKSMHVLEWRSDREV